MEIWSINQCLVCNGFSRTYVHSPLLPKLRITIFHLHAFSSSWTGWQFNQHMSQRLGEEKKKQVRARPWSSCRHSVCTSEGPHLPAVLTILKTFTYKPIIKDDYSRCSFRSIKVLLESDGGRLTADRLDNSEWSKMTLQWTVFCSLTVLIFSSGKWGTSHHPDPRSGAWNWRVSTTPVKSTSLWNFLTDASQGSSMHKALQVFCVKCMDLLIL